MNVWTFIIASYGLTFAGVVALTWWSFAAMRRAESEADAVKQRR